MSKTELERLRAENDRLRAILREVVVDAHLQIEDGDDDWHVIEVSRSTIEKAIAAITKSSRRPKR